MKYIYPVLISKSNKYMLVSIPDLEINTQGTDLLNAIEMARDAISLIIVTKQDLNQKFKEPSFMLKHKEDELLTFVDVDIDAYRRSLENRTVRKNLSIPSWLNEKAEKENINFSALLVKALKKELKIK